MSNDLQVEVDRLVSIAHLHARNALSQPEPLRELHLDVCRGFWKHYAAAFTSDESQSDAFAAALDRATRELIAGMQESSTPVQVSNVLRMSDADAPLHPEHPAAMTLDELRPIFRKIIEQ